MKFTAAVQSWFIAAVGLVFLHVGFRMLRLLHSLVATLARCLVAMVDQIRHPAIHCFCFCSTPRRDILLMKRNNINAMRCSHYPNDIRW